MSYSSFCYLALNHHAHEIRVLTLWPGCPDDPLQCDLSTARLTTRPVFNALSYVWGDPVNPNDPDTVITLDGCNFPVTASLFSALRHLRPPVGGHPLRLWVDAVCINQADLEERSQQVAMMRDIYASAERVVIWLGDEDDDSNAVFDALGDIVAPSSHQYDEEQAGHRQMLMRQCSGAFYSLADRRPWFSRVWILQELAMAKQDPLVACGWKSVAWSVFIDACKIIARALFTEIGMVRQKVQDGGYKRLDGTMPDTDANDVSDDNTVKVLAKLKIDVLEDLHDAVRTRNGESLWKLLIISRTSESTDPRDRVYGLLGLLEPDALDPQNSFVIPIDYRKPTAAVYADAVSHIFSRGEGPYFLSGAFLPGTSAAAPHINSLPSTIAQPSLPTWVPDLSRQVAGKATQPSGIQFHPPAGISVSGVGTDCNNGRVLEDGRTLQVEGLLVDTIERVIPLGTSFDSLVEKLPDIESRAAEARERPFHFGPSTAALIEQFKRKEPLWRTLISNKRFMSGYDAAPSTYEEAYLNLLNQRVSPLGADRSEDDAQGNEYELCLERCINNRTFFLTKGGFFGICVPDSREGDIVSIIFGSPVPFILRPAESAVSVSSCERDYHFLVGASYVSGIMSGELVDELYCEDLMDSTTFFIQ
ncbi:HET-domain-containing protein [Mytilinidion resinicola]|uniref:HET-domain-containing protein n=1 Tax=Mytilinidion resinicola TaxID=574789 RepID=A0A6A6Z4X6_9PEZI|nr:HET-domain-containing protein [Mytilinidion resinicola]KAF2815344.1 HET-domain-containing protein [Mytilinidion resinicola]